MQNIASLFTQRGIVVALMQCNMLLVVFSPDVYMGIADYYYFMALVCLISLGTLNKSNFNEVQTYLFFCIGWLLSVSLITSFILIGEFSTGYAISYVLYLLFFIVLLNYNFDTSEIRRVLDSYLWSGCLIAFLIVYYRKTFYDGQVRFTVQVLDHPMFDPNFLGAFLVFPFIISSSKFILKRSFLYLFSTLLILCGLLMTASRGAMLSSSFGFIFVSAQILKKRSDFYKIFLVAILLLLLSYQFVDFIPEGSYERLFVDSYDDGSNAKRLNNWEFGIDAFFKSPLFGYGLNGEMKILRSAVHSNRVAHNTYIAFLLQFGIVGCASIMYGIVKLFRKVIKYREYAMLGILLSTLFVNIFISGEVAIFFWFPIIYVSLMLQRISKQRQLSFVDFL